MTNPTNSATHQNSIVPPALVCDQNDATALKIAVWFCAFGAILTVGSLLLKTHFVLGAATLGGCGGAWILALISYVIFSCKRRESQPEPASPSQAAQKVITEATDSQTPAEIKEKANDDEKIKGDPPAEVKKKAPTPVDDLKALPQELTRKAITSFFKLKLEHVSFETYLNSNGELIIATDAKYNSYLRHLLQFNDSLLYSQIVDEKLFLKLESCYFHLVFNRELIAELEKESPLLTTILKPLSPESRGLRPALLNAYAKEMDSYKGKEEELLKTAGKGGYILFSSEMKNRFNAVYKDKDGKTRRESIACNDIWHGDLYNAAYEELKHPILAPNSLLHLSAIQNAMMTNKYVAFKRHLHSKPLERIGMSENEAILEKGLLQNFVKWVEMYPDTNFGCDPSHFFKILGHYFGFQGSYSYQYRQRDVRTIAFEGTTGGAARGLLVQDMVDFLAESNMDEALKEKLLIMCRHAVCIGEDSNPTPQDLMKLLDAGVPITIITGWPGHSFNMTLTKDSIVITNKGEGAGETPGMNEYTITVPITEKILTTLLDPANRTRSFFPADINDKKAPLVKLLGLQYKRSLPSSYQKAGTCAVTNNKFALKSAALLITGDEKTASEIHGAFGSWAKKHWLNFLFLLIENTHDNSDVKKELYFFLIYLKSKLEIKLTVLGAIKKKDGELLKLLRDKAADWLKTEKYSELPPYLRSLSSAQACEFNELDKRHQEILQSSLYRLSIHYAEKLARKSKKGL